MFCRNCYCNRATVHVTAVDRGQRTTHLCDACAREAGLVRSEARPWCPDLGDQVLQIKAAALRSLMTECP